MKLAVMQPYFFPYIGYWQLIHAADKFVIYDDVNYIKGGWVNRNRIPINGKPSYITVPLHKASSYKRICDIDLQFSPIWRNKLIKKFQITYQNATYFSEVFPVIEKLIRKEVDRLSDYLSYQLQTLAIFMGINTEFIVTSRYYGNEHMSSQERIIDICKQEQTTIYINPQGGLSLYSSEAFRDAGIDLRFIVMRTLPYTQRTDGFIPYLSIIDALMEVGPANMNGHLNAFDLILGENSNAK